MKKKMFEKTLVIVVIFLFVGTNASSIINAGNNEINRKDLNVNSIGKKQLLDNDTHEETIDGIMRQKKVDTVSKEAQSEKTEVRLLDSDESGLTIGITVDKDDLSIEPVLVDDEMYYKISLLDNPSTTTEVGRPQIPIIFEMIALPETVDVDIEILSSTYTSLGDYNIFPVPELVERETPDGYSYLDEVFSIDEKFYSKNAFYPDTSAEITSIGHIRDQRIARLNFYPIQYNPATQELCVYSMKVGIFYSRDTKLEIKDVGPFDSICSNLVLNYDSSKSLSINKNKYLISRQGGVLYPDNLSDPSNSADYLIITSDTFYDPAKQDHDNGTLNNRLNELAHWRSSYNGFDVAVVNVNDSFIGGNNDTYIKEFIDYVYNNWSAPHMSDNHVGYILLIGDTLFVTSHALHGEGVSDWWYGCFQYDNETGLYIRDDDYSTPDIMIGRFSVDNQTELDVIADKTIQYEQNPVPGDWHKKVLMCRGNRGEPGGYGFTKEILLELGGWEVFEIFLREYIEEYGGGEEAKDAATADIIDNISDGRSIVVYTGHGWRPGWIETGFNYDDIFHLNNGYKLPLVYSLTCDTGEFQAGVDCFGEVFLNTPNKGAVAFWGASKLSSPSSWLSNYLFEQIFENFEYVIGKIITESMIQTGGSYRYYNLLGDPALDLSGSTGYPDKPDLTLSHLNITISPDPPTTEDEEVTINTTIHNIGGGTANNVTVRFIVVDRYDNPQIIGEQNVSVIPPQNRSTLTQMWNISEEFGKKSLIVQIDPLDSVNESFELNNQAGIKVTILIYNTTYVDDDYNESTPGWGYDHFDRIQDGVDAVVEHGTVIVYPGTYYENVVLEKPVDMLGDDRGNTIIDGNLSDDAVCISTNGVSISGFTIQNGVNAGIKVINSNYSIIADNIIANNVHGITLSGSYNIVSENIIRNNNEEGVYVSDSFNTIINNTIRDNFYGGIRLGLLNGFSHFSSIIGNTITNNNHHGIYLQSSTYNTISRNIIKINDNGIILTGLSSQNNIYENTFKYNNITGINISSLSNDNILYRNNFIINTQNAYDEGTNIWYNGTLLEGNYWSDFTSNPGWPYVYRILGNPPSNQDWFPLMAPWVIWKTGSPKNRYISLKSGLSEILPQAFRITVVSCPLFPSLEETQYWVGEVDPTDGTAYLENEPYYHSWAEMIHVGDKEIVPNATYRVEATIDGENFSNPVEISTTTIWGDVNNDGDANLFDLLEMNDGLNGTPSLDMVFLDLAYTTPNRDINLMDLLDLLDALAGLPYPYNPS